MTDLPKKTQDLPYYAISSKVPLASRLSLRVRRQIFNIFMSEMNPSEKLTVLDIGVTSDEKEKESNFFEELYPYKNRITAAGIEDSLHLEKRHKGLQFVKIKPHSRLPFSDGQFDVVFSNAVIEHVGDEQKQRFFVQECLRVGKAFFLTTPNRWFPIELHTVIPFLHYLPPRIYRASLRKIGLSFYADENNLNLLDSNDFRKLFPKNINVQIRKATLFGLPSNLLAFGKSQS